MSYLDQLKNNLTKKKKETKIKEEILLEQDKSNNYSKIFEAFIKNRAKIINELFAKVPMNTNNKNKDSQILRTAIIAENDAINLYEQMSNETSNKDIKKVLLDIAKEEKVHVGEFEHLLEKFDAEYMSSEKEGKREAKKILK